MSPYQVRIRSEMSHFSNFCFAQIGRISDVAMFWMARTVQRRSRGHLKDKKQAATVFCATHLHLSMSLATQFSISSNLCDEQKVDNTPHFQSNSDGKELIAKVLVLYCDMPSGKFISSQQQQRCYNLNLKVVKNHILNEMLT